MTFRSIDMQHYTMVIPSDHAYDTINQIAMLDSVHFIDISSHTHRPFLGQLKRCDELLHSIGMMKSSLDTADIQFDYYDVSEKGYMEQQCKRWRKEAKKLGVHDSKLLDHYEAQIHQEYERYQESLKRLDKLKLRSKSLLEQIACAETVESFFGQTDLRRESKQYFEFNAPHGDEVLSGISYIVGIIDQEAEVRFNKMIYRVSRGYACTRALDEFKFKGLHSFQERVIMVIYPNSSSEVLGKKIMRVMQTFCLNVTELNNQDSSTFNLGAVSAEFEETENYIEMEERELRAFLERISQLDCIDKWRKFVWKEKYLYETLNKLEVRSQFMLANIYIPTDRIKELSIKLSHLVPAPTLQPTALAKPPTVFDTNSYTTVAQEITDTYGVPRYKEINPTIFTTITFPFFFGVMFGDIGHGLVLFALGLFLIFFDEEVRRSKFSAFSRLRYMVALMGFFAFYCGWVYNDFIGFSMNLFGSCYGPVQPQLEGTGEVIPTPIYPKAGCVYPFGIDPIWGRAENELVFINGLKMKLAVIIGVIHMTLGICAKAYNAVYFKRKLDFWFQFVPQLVFMVLLFGYMDFLIIFKWLKVWDEKIGDVPPRQWAPSIITTMMNIGLAMGKTSGKPDGGSSMWGGKQNSWQDQLQLGILLIAFVCIPLMLLPKPIIEIRAIKRKRNPLMGYEKVSRNQISASLLSSGRYSYEDIEKVQAAHTAGEEESHEEPSEIFVHQLIETIEFVLGAVSNTASYLRLWALSLAHSQLAKVFFQKTLQNALEMPSIIVMIPSMLVTFFLLCWITMGVLMCMDTMECFLHSLRLHWVQFQNKFYKGDGYKFQPLSYHLFIQEQSSK